MIFALFETISQALAYPVTQSSDRDAIKHTVGFIQRSWVILAVAIAITAAAAEPVIRFVYGNQWSGSIVPLIILTTATGALAIAGSLYIALLRFVRPILLAGAAIAAAAVNIAANFALIPLWGIDGAATASVLSYWLLAGLLVRLFSRATQVRPSLLFKVVRVSWTTTRET
jgi:O-antigen/teichoic acid export membrane protein